MLVQGPLLFYILIMILPMFSRDALTHAGSTNREVGRPVVRTTRTNTTVYAWSAWGKWSPCSRTCGGGVSMQQRYCLPRDPGRMRRSRKRRKLVRSVEYPRRARSAAEVPDSVPDCPGLARRYHECNTAGCPGAQRDPRSEQCAVYDRRPFRGRFYTWAPYVDGDSPCTLNCRPRGQQFYASLALVTDGTPCTKPGFRAICVQGSCKGPLVLRTKDVDGRQFKWLDKRWLRYDSDFGVISYKDNLEEESPFFKLNLKRRGSTAPDNIPVISLQLLPISKEKKEDLISLLSLIPDVFHKFYIDLPTANDLRNTDPDIIDSEDDD